MISAEAASKAVADSTLDKSVPGKHRVVLDINHTTRVTGAYPIVLVSYDIACPAYTDANTARFAKSWLSYVTSEEGQAPGDERDRIRAIARQHRQIRA